MAERLAMREHNRQVLAGETPADRAEAERLRELSTDIEDFLPPSSSGDARPSIADAADFCGPSAPSQPRPFADASDFL